MDILVVEDDDGVAEALEQTLKAHGHHTDRARTGTEALNRFGRASLILLDLGLPDLEGHEVCRRIRAQSCVPIITVSGRTDELDRVMALHMGADDFVDKPVGRYELVARIEAVTRRTRGCPHHVSAPRQATWPVRAAAAAQEPTAPKEPAGPAASAPADGQLRAGPLRLDPKTRRVFLDGAEVVTTRKEFDLLALLMREPGTVRERHHIMTEVWDANWFGSTRTLDVHVGSLRTKLGDTEWIETVRGVGYRLAVPQALLV
ncbi:response regulator transcription factor [Streptomyces beihaiensis]|uniref:Sensory transduction protein RegX3 n=1 Tax=Streptomyces beihaiensis TaxID=2984495 RepID=A0ABT3TYA7_9ACTN|nr:response regulator transcription factor [Streptomyces beihaiensis]MCX3061377.1 response regulator transcription factor [Streptomyces beihaiensis]